MIDFPFMREAFLVLVRGVPLTLNLAIISVTIGSILAMILTVMRFSDVWVIRAVSRTYVFMFRGTPLLVQIFLIYYGLGQFRPTLQQLGLWTLLREPYWCAVLALAMNTAAYASEIMRGGWQAVPRPQIEAARACGMSGMLLFRRILFPIALRQALPAYGSELILMVKATSLASVITMLEITGLASRLISETYRVVEVFLVAGVIYLALNLFITRAIVFVEWRLSAHLRQAALAYVPHT